MLKNCHFSATALAVCWFLTSAQVVADAVDPHCLFTEIDVNQYGKKPFANPATINSQQGKLVSTLQIAYTDKSKTSIGGCPVKLRSYNEQLVGPTLRVRPGETMNILLQNRLPKETPQEIADQFQQESSHAWLGTRPHSYNTTNLHTHGLHVSPTGNSDNVLLAVLPQTELPYEIKVPLNHPPGTYWYHAHAHGSVAIQVSSGMAGAIVIDDDPDQLPPALRDASRPEHEKVMVFQTTFYDTQGEVNHITSFFPDPSRSPDQGRKNCSESNPDKDSLCTWGFSNRLITINGQIVPKITMRPGEVQRWRLIDTAYRESIQLRLEGHDLHEIAIDGIYHDKIDTWSEQACIQYPKTRCLNLQPGYRSDVLVKAATPGVYRLIDVPSSPEASVLIAAEFMGLLGAPKEAEHVLAEVVVEGQPMDMALPTSEQIASLAPFKAVKLKDRAIGQQTVQFSIGSDLNPDPAKQRNYFQVNYQAFDPSKVRKLQLGAIDRWNLKGQGHVFHIHVNPFQWERSGPDGNPEWVWKDTLFVSAKGEQVYTQYLDYLGQFVMHCHILDHEDLGMMEVDQVVEGENLAKHGAGTH